MTSTEWLKVGATLLGLYFVVQSVVMLAGVPAAWGMVVPDGVGRWALVATYLSRVVLALVAGLLLIRWSRRLGTPELPSPLPATSSVIVAGLQLIGVVFLLDGAVALVREALEAAILGEAWQIRLGDIVGATLSMVVGAVLIAKCRDVEQRLQQWRELSA